MGTFTSVSLYDRGSTRPVSGRTVRVTSWPDGGPVETDPAVLTTDYYGATPEFSTVDPDVHAVRITAAATQPRTVWSVETATAIADAGPFLADADQRITELESRSGTSGTVRMVEGVVTLTTEDPRLVEVYAISAALVQGETLPTDTAAVFRRLISGAWQVMVVGVDNAWRAPGGPPDETPPSAPTNLVATPAANSCTLTWSPATDDVAVAGYEERHRKTGDPTWSAWTDIVSGGEVTGLTPSTGYDVEVRAYDLGGNRGPAVAGTFTTTAVPLTGDITDTFAGTDEAPIVGRTTTTGGKVWAAEESGRSLVGWSNTGLVTRGGEMWNTVENSSVFITVPPGGVEVSFDYWLWHIMRVAIGVGVQGGTDPTSVLRLQLDAATSEAKLFYDDKPTGGSYIQQTKGTAAIPLLGRITLVYDGTDATVKSNDTVIIGPVSAPLTATGRVAVGIGKTGASHLGQMIDNMAVNYL